MVCAQLMHKKNTSKDCDKRDNNNNNNNNNNQTQPFEIIIIIMMLIILHLEQVRSSYLTRD